MTATRETYWGRIWQSHKTEAFATRNPRSDFSVPYPTTECPVRPAHVALHTSGR